MKVALISAFPKTPQRIFGGVEGATKYLVDELVKLPDLSVSVIVPQGAEGAELVLERWDGGLTVFRLPKTGPFRRLPGTLYELLAGKQQVERLLARLAPDVAHFQGASLLAARCARRSVLTIHGLDEKDAAWDPREGASRWLKRGLLTLTERYGRRGAPNVILVSDETREVLSAGGSQRTWRIPNPIADSFFEIERRPSPGRVFCCSRVTALKNLLGMIEAFALVVRRAPGAELRIAGTAEDGYLAECRRRVEQLGLGTVVRFLGGLSVAGVQAELASAACFALPSFREMAPLALAEAMAAGVPAVAARVGGVPEMVADGDTGLLVDPRDARGISEAVVSLLAEPARAEAMGGRAKKAAQARHKASEVARRTAEVYREILGRW